MKGHYVWILLNTCVCYAISSVFAKDRAISNDSVYSKSKTRRIDLLSAKSSSNFLSKETDGAA